MSLCTCLQTSRPFLIVINRLYQTSFSRLCQVCKGSYRAFDAEVVLLAQALTNKQTVSALVEVLEDAAAMGAEFTELGEGIRQRLERARAWEAEASQFFAKPGRAPLFALEVFHIIIVMRNFVSSRIYLKTNQIFRIFRLNSKFTSICNV